MRKLLFLMVPLLSAVLTGCGGGDDGEGGSHAQMSPGENCMRSGCHSNFSVAGTVLPSANSPASAGIAGVSVVVTDNNNVQITLTSNAAGNFYSSQRLALPLQSVTMLRNGTRTVMSSPDGACAACHVLGSDLGAVYAN